MALEKTEKCPICRGTSFIAYLTCIDYTTSKREFNLTECANCHFIITSPRPDSKEIGEYYKSESYISHTGTSKSLINKIYLKARSISLKRKRKLIQLHSHLGNLLDYGCGTGDFINECKLNGWDVQGIEPSTEARIKAQKLTNAKIFPNISEVTDNQFDTITLWHVLEHVHDLNSIMEKLIELLKPNGTIFIAVPNHNSWDANKYKKYWAAYDVPRHLWHFSKDNISMLLKHHGMKVNHILPMKLDAYYVSLLSEQYKNPDQSIVKRYIRGFINGLTSNINARKKNNYSSLIYVIKR